jgi:hypothetical protein
MQGKEFLMDAFPFLLGFRARGKRDPGLSIAIPDIDADDHGAPLEAVYFVKEFVQQAYPKERSQLQ